MGGKDTEANTEELTYIKTHWGGGTDGRTGEICHILVSSTLEKKMQTATPEQFHISNGVEKHKGLQRVRRVCTPSTAPHL